MLDGRAAHRYCQSSAAAGAVTLVRVFTFVSVVNRFKGRAANAADMHHFTGGRSRFASARMAGDMSWLFAPRLGSFLTRIVLALRAFKTLACRGRMLAAFVVARDRHAAHYLSRLMLLIY